MEPTSSLDYSNLLDVCWNKSIVRDWLKEDIPSFDYGGFVVGSKQELAILFGKSEGVLAGSPFFEEIFKTLGCRVQWKVQEGCALQIPPNGRQQVALDEGEACKLLDGERTALNLLARASGIATLARKTQELAKLHNWNGKVAGTRKTTPGFRLVEKYSLLVGGCDTHRMDLSSMIMLKDNHIWSCGSITNAVKKAISVGGFSLKIEVECRSYEEAIESINAGAHIVMLDNFEPNKLKETAEAIKKLHPYILIEASGGVTLETLSNYFSPFVDIISMGNLTQGVPHVDFSLKIQPQEKATQ